MADEQRAGDSPVDPLLGHPRMVADPRISIRQAGVVLGKSPGQVRRFIALGRLPRHGPSNNGWPLLLSQVVALRAKGEPINLAQAARECHCAVVDIQRLVADGRLALVPGTTKLVYPADVEAIAATSASDLPETPQAPAGSIPTAAVADRLGLSESCIRQMAADGRLPAVSVAGRWWFDPDRIAMIARARQARVQRSLSAARFE